jgi:hypothetical protein
MKTAISMLTALVMAGASSQRASAGDREWAVAGKVLTGVFAASVISRAFEQPPVYQAPVVYAPAPPPPTVVYLPAPPPSVVVVPSPAPVVLAPAPIVVYQQPVYVQPAPVYVVQRAYVMAPPLVSFHFGHGRHHGWR